MKVRISADGEHLNLFPIDYGAMNRPLGERRRRRYSRGGYPPSHPCPPNVDPETGEIKGESLSSRVLTEVLGKRLPPSREAWQKAHPLILGARTLRHGGFPAPKGRASPRVRLALASLAGIAIISAVLFYHPSITKPVLPPGTQKEYVTTWADGKPEHGIKYVLPDGRTYDQFVSDWYDQHRSDGRSLFERWTGGE
jgi:hypothetical protein